MNLNNITSLVSEPSTSKNILTSDVELTGTLKFETELIFDGKLEGEIISEGTLILGKNAVVKGEVRTKSVTIHGTVNGNVTVQERCELKSNAELLGDLKAMRIIIEEGATFIGHSEVTPTKTASFTRSSAPSQVNENAA
ncbi:MAG: polymer-forming cytoskeletal protein [Verrucomicrobia bacterium]|jgi:cytoskeletal protein CcmA (bactofilin family)|nr:polymer-forming cytoskeletal protein [Verrucomicrobiota bacterium]